MNRGRWLAVAVAAAMTGGAVVWAVNLPSFVDDEPAETGVPGLEHVHGLGINPEDGNLYVATHFGTFAGDEDGSFDRVGDSFQDTMGFTVVGPDRFLGSGHPDVAGMRAGQPGRLGLIESTDAGETWQSVSLSGEADFHGLAYVDGATLGWDAGTARFLASDDGETWDERSIIELSGFAVDPAGADRVIAATSSGVQISGDGGRSWSPTDAPELVVLSWAQGGTIWGARAEGDLYRSTDAGATWERSGDLGGTPQALIAIDEEVWAATTTDEVGGAAIVRSSDGGATWDDVYRDGAAHGA